MHQIYSEKQGFHFTVFPADFIDWEVERQRYFVDCDERIFRPIDVSSDIDFLFPNSKSVEQQLAEERTIFRKLDILGKHELDNVVSESGLDIQTAAEDVGELGGVLKPTAQQIVFDVHRKLLSDDRESTTVVFH